jgi:hypothetical protein
MYKILVDIKDRHVVEHKRFFITLLKTMTDRSRIIIVEKVLKNRNIKLERYIPAQINRLNHK